MALSTARIHRVRGRPPLLAAGIISLIHSHSSSVRSLGYIFSFIYPFYTTHEDFSDRLLKPESLAQHRKEPIGGDDPDNTRDHRGRRRSTHGRGAAATLHAAQTAGQRYQGAKDHALD